VRMGAASNGRRQAWSTPTIAKHQPLLRRKTHISC
jgi:hypothetical protein